MNKHNKDTLKRGSVRKFVLLISVILSVIVKDTVKYFHYDLAVKFREFFAKYGRRLASVGMVMALALGVAAVGLMHPYGAVTETVMQMGGDMPIQKQAVKSERLAVDTELEYCIVLPDGAIVEEEGPEPVHLITACEDFIFGHVIEEEAAPEPAPELVPEPAGELVLLPEIVETVAVEEVQAVPNSAGRVVIPGLVDLNLVRCDMGVAQGVIDGGSAALFGFRGMSVIGAHKHKGFSPMKSSVPGSTHAYVDGVEYLCEANFTGHNTESDMTDDAYNPISYDGIVMYTCNDNWRNITITYWRVVQ